MSKKRVLTIKADYCKDWTIKETLRIVQFATLRTFPNKLGIRILEYSPRVWG